MSVSRRTFIIGGVSAAVAAATATGCGEDPPDAVRQPDMPSPASTSPAPPPTSTGRPPEPAYEPPPDLASWFSDPEGIAALGAAPVGDPPRGCSPPAPAAPANAGELRARVAGEAACGSVQAIGGWFLTPSEIAIAAALAEANGG